MGGCNGEFGATGQRRCHGSAGGVGEMLGVNGQANFVWRVGAVMQRATASRRSTVDLYKFPALGLAVVVMFLLANTALPASNDSQPLVGHIMALLSVFEHAHALPPEDSPGAQTLIHALIQTQTALRSTTHQATRVWFSKALLKGQQVQGKALPADALTSRTLEAILSYATYHPPTHAPAVMAGLTEFNIGGSELELMAKVYWDAKSALGAMGEDIHASYEKERRATPSPR